LAGARLAVEADYLSPEEETGAVILPIAVKEIAGDDDKIDLLGNGKVHQVCECPAGGSAQGFHRRALMEFQALEGAIQVRIGGVDKAEHSKKFKAEIEAKAKLEWRSARGR
jgi:hypothetical protein